MKTILSLAIGGILTSGSAFAFEMGMPIDCELGKSCYIQNYVDHDPKVGSSDFTCGNLTYDGHKGTDFALYSVKNMEKGVSVFAAAEGTVKGVRDSMRDEHMDSVPVKLLKGRECGNGLVIDHGKGWETQYCHMKKGSIVVKEGDKVSKGQVLGQVGLSGKTQFAHLHVSVRKDGEHMDPFTSREMDMACSVSPQRETLWETEVAKQLTYSPTGAIAAGIIDEEVTMEQVFSGSYAKESINHGAPKMVFWSAVYGVQSGDEIRMKLTSPSGVVMSQMSKVVPTHQVRRYDYIGAKNEGLFTTGTYVGDYELLRSGAVVAKAGAEVVVSD